MGVELTEEVRQFICNNWYLLSDQLSKRHVWESAGCLNLHNPPSECMFIILTSHNVHNTEYTCVVQQHVLALMRENITDMLIYWYIYVSGNATLAAYFNLKKKHILYKEISFKLFSLQHIFVIKEISFFEFDPKCRGDELMGMGLQIGQNLDAQKGALIDSWEYLEKKDRI